MVQPPEDVGSAKRALRATLLAGRLARDPERRITLGTALADTAMRQSQLVAARCICAYVGVDGEPSTGPLLDRLQDAGVEVRVPILAPDRALDWAQYGGAEALAPGPFGLLEPVGPRLGPDAAAAADLLLVPALAVDVHGARLGRGGGYYDRLLFRLADALPARTSAPASWAVVYDEEVLESLPSEPHDVPVTGALTPGGFHRLG